MNDSNLENQYKKLSRLCIEQLAPAEAPFFDTIWDIIRQRIFFEGLPLPPEEWPTPAKGTGPMIGLGVHGGEHELKSPIIILALNAIALAWLSSQDRSKRELDKLTEKYTREFKTPSWTIPLIKAFVLGQVPEFSEVSNIKKGRAEPYLIWENANLSKPATEEHLNNLRNSALEGKIMLFADDVNGKLWVYGKESKLKAGETDSWRTLCALIEKIGNLWTWEDLWCRVRPGENYKKGENAQHVYQWVRHITDTLSKDIKKFFPNKSQSLPADWFKTGQRNRVVISSNLRGSVVRRNPA